MTRRPALAAAALGGCLALAMTSMPDAAAVRSADAPAQFSVAGAGFGHGVGMSQWGAFGMAEAGFDATGIVTHYYTGTTVTPVQDDMDIRVNLLYRVGSAKVRAEGLDPSGGAIEVTVGGNVVVGGPADEFRFAASAGAVTVTRITGGQPTDLGAAPSVTIRWAGTRTPGAAPGGPTLLNVVSGSSLDSSGHRYRYGSVDIAPAGGGSLNVVNSVRLHDEYLYGISEVSSSWPAAAQQAQALAARTYALSKVSRGVRAACNCHVDDGGGPYSDQTFTGWAKASAPKGDQWVANVNATAAAPNAGLAILYNGQPISAFYSASSGGATQSVQDVWGGALPYAVSVPDPYMQVPENPNRAWTVAVSQSAMAKAFGVPAVQSVAVTERFASGAVKSIAATGVDGAVVTKSGNAFQGALGLKSSYVTTIDGNPGVPIAAPVVTPAPAPAPAQNPAPAMTPAVKARTVSLLTATAVTRKAGSRYKVVGVVRPAKAGLHAWRQVLVDGQWQTTAKTRTNGRGRYRFARIEAKGAGTTKTFRVLIVRKKTVVGVSPEFTVAVQPK